MRRKLVWGVGINDVDEPTSYKVMPEERNPSGGLKHVACPYYQKWKSMLLRCYSTRFQERQPTYIDCTVCDDWITFSNFKVWMGVQEWEGMELDKDFLSKGSKVYSPDTCIFIHTRVNAFLNDHKNSRGSSMLGTQPSGINYRSDCRNPFVLGNKSGYVGSFDTDLEAHLAWKNQKHKYACQLADSEYVTDERIKRVLLNKYKNYNIVEEHIM